MFAQSPLGVVEIEDPGIEVGAKAGGFKLRLLGQQNLAGIQVFESRGNLFGFDLRYAELSGRDIDVR